VAVDTAGNRSGPATDTAAPDATLINDTTPPGSVTHLNAVPGNGQVTLTWTDPEDEDLSYVAITFVPGVDGIAQPITVTGAQTHTVRDLANEITYTFTVVSVDTSDNRSGPATDTATPSNPDALNTIAKIEAYLAGAAGGNSAADPLPLAAELNLNADWQNLLSAIQTADKYVELDLTACTMANMTDTAGEFDPGTASAGKNRITALILPNEAASIKAGTSDNPSPFLYFTSLKTISGNAVTSIDEGAFLNRIALTTVSFPEAITISFRAFYGCTALTEVSLPMAATINITGLRALYRPDRDEPPEGSNHRRGGFLRLYRPG
jgi:hypothetical protein